MPAKPKTDRVAVRATNHQTGEQWSIHDSRDVCEAELERKLAEWGDIDSDHVTVEWADIVDGTSRQQGIRGVVEADAAESGEA